MAVEFEFLGEVSIFLGELFIFLGEKIFFLGEKLHVSMAIYANHRRKRSGIPGDLRLTGQRNEGEKPAIHRDKRPDPREGRALECAD